MITFRMDQTAPEVAFSVNAGTVYWIDETVAIACLAVDTGSGIASSTCEDITVPAYAYESGIHAIAAHATDAAGNEGSGTL